MYIDLKLERMVTNQYEKLVNEHKNALVAYQKYRKAHHYRMHSENLYYSFQLASGKIHHVMGKVCFAQIHYFDSEDVFGEYEDGDEEATDDNHTIDAIILHPYGTGVNPERAAERMPEYQLALREWCELFSPILVEATFEERLEHGIIVDMTRGSCVDNVGAFLVGFRNLHEQGYYQMFNHLLDHGISHAVAAYGTQLLCFIEPDKLNWGATHHNTICTQPAMYQIDKIKERKDSCILYDKDHMVGKGQHRGKLMWVLSENFYRYVEMVQYPHPRSLKTYLEPAKLSVGRTTFDRYDCYDLAKTTPLLLELLSE